MKKLTALLLALIMVLSVFAACGEKTDVNDTGADAAQASDAAADVAADVATPDDDEGDKEATETVTETGEVALPPANTQTPAAEKQTPQGQVPSQTPQTQQNAQAPSSSAPSGGNAQSAPVSSGAQNTSPLPSENRDHYKIHVFGDAVIITHSPFEVLFGMARAAGHDVDLSGTTASNLGETTTYSIYDVCTFTGSGVDIKATGFKKSSFKNAISNKLDCLIILSSRDRAFMSVENEAKLLEAFDYTQKTYYAANPNGKIILFVPMPYKNTQGEHGEKFKVNDVDQHGHNERIKAFAQKMGAKATGNLFYAQIGDAFEWFEQNYAAQGYELYDQGGIYQNVAGSYFISCLTYAYIFNESPVGITEYGFLMKDDAEFIQKAAHKFVFGTDAPSSVKHAAPIPHDAFEECDPRTMSKRDERFKNEVYPQYFDEFFATAYCYEAFGGAVQYDQKNIGSISGVEARRLYQGVDPNFITPRRISYLDCTWFCHSVYSSAFNYTIKESISTKVIDTTDGEVYRRTSERIKADPEEARKEFLETIQPGDMIMYSDREAGVSHGMLYIGNGMTIHCSSGSRKAGGKADYNKTAKIDSKEPLGGVLYSELGVVCDDTSSEYYCFKGNKDLLLLRPLASGVKPTADAVARAKNLKGVICWKESDRTGGATVNPGEDVTFTYFIRNDTMKDKQISVTDKLPANTTFKSGDVKFTNGALDTTVTVPARSLVSLSFTVTVSPSAPYGKIPCGDTAIGGVKLYDYAPIVVAKTLTAAEQAKIAAAKVTASSDSELIAKTYAEIGKTVNLPSGADLLNRFMSVSAKSVSFTLSSKDFKLVPQGLYGGKYYPGTEFERIRHIGVENAMCGDVLIVLRDPSKLNEVQCYLCVGDGKFKTTENGAVKDVPSVAAASLFDSLLGEHAFLIIRPSFGF